MQIGDVSSFGVAEELLGLNQKAVTESAGFGFGVEGSQDPAVQQEVDTTTDEEAREKAQAELEHQAKMKIIRDYIETCGAPEEKEQDRVADDFLKRLQEQEDDKRKQGLSGNALKTWAEVMQDPEDEGKMHVYAMKTDAEGKAKITRHMEFDSGDGEDRSQLTAERAKAKKAYEKQMAEGEAGDRHEDRSDRKTA